MHSKSKKFKRQAKQREQRRRKKLEKNRRKKMDGPRAASPPESKVAKRLLAGKVAMVGGTG